MSADTRLFAVLPTPARPRNSYSSKDVYKVGRLFCRVLWPWFLIAERPRGGIEHYGNWVCQPTTSLRERCEHTHEGWRNVSKQCRSARPVRHKSYVAEQRAVQYQHNQKPTTSSVLQNDGPPCRAIHDQSTYLGYSYVRRDLHTVCELLHLRLSLF